MTSTGPIIERLLLLDRLKQLPALLEAELPFDGAQLLADMRARSAAAKEAGRHAESGLLLSLLPQVEAALPRSALAGVGPPATPTDLLDRLLAFDSLLDQYLYARRHPELAKAAAPLVRSWFAQARGAEVDRHAAVCAVVAVCWGGPDERVLGRLLWSAVLRRRDATRAALWQLDRAEPDAADCAEDVRFQILAARVALLERSGDAEAAVRQAYEGLAEVESQDHTVVAQSLHHSLARNLRSLGRTSAALSHADSALALLTEPWMSDLRAHVLNLRGLIKEDLGEYDLGAADYSAAVAAAQRTRDERIRFTAATNHAASLLKAGRQREALQAFEEILTDARRDQQHRKVAPTLNNIGQILLQMGDAAGAHDCFRDAINARATLPLGDEGEIISWFGLGDALSALGDDEAAEQMYLLALVTGMTAGHYRTALADYALRSKQADGDREELRGLLEDAYAQSDSGPHRSLIGPRLATELIEAGREEEGHALLADLLAEMSARDPESLDCLRVRVSFASALAHRLDRPRDALEMLQEARRHVQRLLARTQVPDRRAELVSEHFSIYEELLGLLVGMPGALGLDEATAWRLAFDLHEEAKSPTTLARLAVSPLTADDVETLLARVAPPEGMAFVSFFCGSQYTYSFLVATGVGLRAERVRVGRDELRGAAEELRRTFNGDPEGFPPLAPLRARAPHRRSIDFLDSLGPRLTAFVRSTAPGTLICAAPHGPLHLIPLHALPLADGTRLVQRNCVTYCPSLSVLAPVLRRNTPLRRTGRALFVGVAAQEDPNPALFETDGGLLGAAGWDVTELTGAAADPAVVLDALRDVDVAHFTCHGFTDPAHPMESGLVLSAYGTRRPPTKHIRRMSVAQRSLTLLRPSQLADQPAVPALITLRACSSAWQAETNRGDESAGLTRVFLQAGARSVLSTLWNVHQESSGRLVSALYARMTADSDAPLWRCYWRAQRELLDRAEAPWLAHPYHFAPMILNGDWR
ncbi:CHAT domain-containing protein [Streptomyces cyaneus]|uniref:CHAT domain-containing protein n=1 Tax=Streptomyces cyaneus TaxID=1904 RepID=UPI000FF8A02B|nr:CHAT domain-containing tetratricopeptide repeat protein [Streptomyces cyaneus]